ncbi:hypothetical protein IMSAGC020_02153 [Lachnospiraceae bacterium]|nr:hypothetical protein IMSAGC020_02153 [Lachnospiraceae bacterium]
MAENKNNLMTIQVYRKKWHLNIGVVIFGIIFLYLVVTVLLYLTENHVTAYEVREGSILRDNAYTGLILRNEVVVQAEADGYVNYFAPEGSKAGVRSKIYTLSDRELDFSDTGGGEERKLTSEEQSAVLMRIQSFCESFREERFGDVYDLKENVTAVLESQSNQNRQARLDAKTGQENSGIQVYQAVSDGIVVYSTDGYETVTADQVTKEMLTKNDYEQKSIKNNTKIEAGDPVYKLIRDDNWSVVIALSDETAAEMRETERIRVRFSKNQETVTAGFSIRETDGASLGILTFGGSMVHYVKDRYLDLELILEDESGLKIPQSAVVDKKFYMISEEYITQGGNSKEDGVLVQKESGKPAFKSVDIYDRDEEAGMVYLNTDAFDEDTVLIRPDSSDTCILNKTTSRKGVYNINKGYAVFKQVNILCEGDGYYIVESGSIYGLSNYDHIALVGSDIRENDVVF